LLTTLFLLLISLTAGSTINWSTSSDWDNAVSNNVEHTSENVSIFTNNWSDDFSDGTCDGWTTVSGSWSCNNNTMQNTDSNNNRKIEKHLRELTENGALITDMVHLSMEKLKPSTYYPMEFQAFRQMTIM